MNMQGEVVESQNVTLITRLRFQYGYVAEKAVDEESNKILNERWLDDIPHMPDDEPDIVDDYYME